MKRSVPERLDEVQESAFQEKEIYMTKLTNALALPLPIFRINTILASKLLLFNRLILEDSSRESFKRFWSSYRVTDKLFIVESDIYENTWKDLKKIYEEVFFYYATFGTSVPVKVRKDEQNVFYLADFTDKLDRLGSKVELAEKSYKEYLTAIEGTKRIKKLESFFEYFFAPKNIPITFPSPEQLEVLVITYKVEYLDALLDLNVDAVRMPKLIFSKSSLDMSFNIIKQLADKLLGFCQEIIGSLTGVKISSLVNIKDLGFLWKTINKYKLIGIEKVTKELINAFLTYDYNVNIVKGLTITKKYGGGIIGEQVFKSEFSTSVLNIVDTVYPYNESPILSFKEDFQEYFKSLIKKTLEESPAPADVEITLEAWKMFDIKYESFLENFRAFFESESLKKISLGTITKHLNEEEIFEKIKKRIDLLKESLKQEMFKLDAINLIEVQRRAAKVQFFKVLRERYLKLADDNDYMTSVTTFSLRLPNTIITPAVNRIFDSFYRDLKMSGNLYSAVPEYIEPEDIGKSPQPVFIQLPVPGNYSVNFFYNSGTLKVNLNKMSARILLDRILKFRFYSVVASWLRKICERLDNNLPEYIKIKLHIYATTTDLKSFRPISRDEFTNVHIAMPEDRANSILPKELGANIEVLHRAQVFTVYVHKNDLFIDNKLADDTIFRKIAIYFIEFVITRLKLQGDLYGAFIGSGPEVYGISNFRFDLVNKLEIGMKELSFELVTKKAELAYIDRYRHFLNIYRSDFSLSNLISSEYDEYIKNGPITYFTSMIRLTKKVSSLIYAIDVSNCGLCSYEAYLHIANPEKEFKGHHKKDWLEFVLKSFTNETDEFRNAIIKPINEFSDYVYKTKKVIMPIYNFHTRQFYLPTIGEVGEEVGELCVLVYKRHAYTAYTNAILELFKHKFESECMVGKILECSGLNTETIVKEKKNYKPFVLKKKNFKEKKYNHYHWAYDYETRPTNEKGDQEPYLLIVINTVLKAEFIFYGKNCTEQFIYGLLIPLLNDIRDKQTYNDRHHFWAYNGSTFDITFIYERLQFLTDLKVTGSSRSIKKLQFSKYIDFMDLACWYSSFYNKEKNIAGLAALCNEVKTEHQKTDLEDKLDVTDEKLQDKKFKEKAIEYCKNDCLCVDDLIKELIIKGFEQFSYKDQRMQVPSSYPCSSASVALLLFEHFFMKEGLELNATANYSAELDSYHGGLVIALKAFAKDIRFFDINSSYPYIMLAKMPVKFMGFRKYTYTAIIPTNLYSVSEFVFPQDTILPNLMLKSDDNGIVNVLEWKGNKEEFQYYWGCELLLAKKMNAKITIVKEFVYETDTVFKDFVDFFYEKKIEAKKLGQMGLALFFKTIMNALQGKLGQRDFGDVDYCVFDTLFTLVADKGPESMSKLDFIGKNTFKVKWKSEGNEILSKIGSLVRFPSYITAQARTNLIEPCLRMLPNGDLIINHVVYMDTDSIVLENGLMLPEDLINNNDLGKFKHEKEKDRAFMLCFGCKNYTIFDMNDDNIKVVCKGINRHVNKEEFKKTLSENKPYQVNLTPFFVHTINSVKVTSCKRTIVPTISFKRKIVENGQTKPYNSLHDQTITIMKDFEETKKLVKEMKEKKPKIKPNNHKEIAEEAKEILDDFIEDYDTRIQMFTAGLNFTQEKENVKKSIIRLFKNEQVSRQLMLETLEHVSSDKITKPVYEDWEGLKIETFIDVNLLNS